MFGFGTVSNVARGAAYLDRVRPGWVLEVDPGRLDLDSTSRCVLGQLFGNYHRYLYRMDLSDWWADRHGFVTWGWSERAFRRRQAALEAEWRRVIRLRRGAELLAA